MSLPWLSLLAGSGLGLTMLAGCASPLYPDEKDLRRSLLDTVRREAAEALRSPQTQELNRQDRVGPLALKPSVLSELEKSSGMKSYQPGTKDLLEPTLLGTKQEWVGVSLERVIATAVANNLNVQFAKLSVAGDQARLVAAEATFDWVLFSNFQWSNLDQERPAQQQAFPPTQRSFDQRQILETDVGLRRRMTSGGQFTIQQSLTYTQNTVEGTFVAPNPANEATLTLQVDQPLLRNFGSDVALAEVRLAVNAERDQIQQLKAELISTVNNVEQAYWRLVQSYGEYMIAKRLLNRGIEVRDVLAIRQDAGMAVNASQLANARAAVETRRGNLIQAENALRAASLRLKQLINDPEFTVGSEILLLPVDDPLDVPMSFSLIDAVTTALARRPEAQRALLNIDDASIRRKVADNQLRPRLDLQLQTRFNALAEGMDTALARETEAGLVEYLIGLVFEQPIGNRAAEATAQARRLEQQQAVVTYRDVVSRIVTDLKIALYDMRSNYILISQFRAARVAAAEDLRTTEVREPLQELSAEALDLKLRKQEAVAAREAQELSSLTGYNVAIARVFAETGTILERNRIRFEVPGERSEQQAGKGDPPRDPIFGLPAVPR